MKDKDTIPELPPEFKEIENLREEVPKVRFPVDALPPIMREMVESIAETTGTDTAMAATCVQENALHSAGKILISRECQSLSVTR